MPAPVAAIAGGIGRGLFTGGRAAMAGGMRETIRGAARGAVKGGLAAGKDVASGVVKGKKKSGKERFKSPLNEGIASGGGGGAIVPFSGGGDGGRMSSSIVPAPKSQVVPAAGSKGKTILDTLNQIKSLLDQILQVEKEEKSKLEDSILDFVKRDERQKRDQEQAKQEAGKKAKGKKGKESPIVKGAKKAVGGLWDFISGIVGDFIKYKILDWVSDPKNRKNVQRIVEFFQGMVKFLGQVFNFVMDNMSRWMEVMTNGFKLAGTLLQPLIDIFTLKWLTNPKEFIDNIIKLPQTLLGIIPDFFGSLLNYLTLGLFENMGKFVGDLLSNLNPFNLFGGKEEDKEGVDATPPKTDSSGVAAAPKTPGAEGATESSDAGKENIPKLEKGGIVGKEGGEKQETGEVTVKPLTELIKESKISSLISDGIKPFMDMMLAPFKIIGTAIVGLILRTVSKIPFVGNLIEPIIKMTASTFGVPTNVLTQLSSGTKKELEKPIDKEKLLEKLFGGFNDLKESIKDSEDGDNPLAKFATGLKNFGGSVTGFMSNLLFGGPAAAATRPTPSPTTSSRSTPSPTPSLPQFASHADAGVAGVSQYTNTADGKSYQKNQGADGWSEMGEDGLGVDNANVVSLSHPETGSGYGVKGLTDAQGRPAVFSKPAAAAFARMVQDSNGQVKGSDIASSQRSPAKNKAVGGAARSRHMSGTAVDIHGTSNAWIRANGSKYGWVAHDYSGSHGGHFIFKGGTAMPPTQTPPPAQVASAGSKTGPALQSMQTESLNLQSSVSSRGKDSTSILNNNTSSTETSTNIDSPSLGGTLPMDGLFATYRTNL